jgi:general secretion pathway protein F
MSVWYYKAIQTSAASKLTSGEQAGESAADVRAALRRIGLQVIDLRPLKRAESTQQSRLSAAARRTLANHLRQRRVGKRAELYDSLATMLESGLQLLEALDTIIDSKSPGNSTWRTMLVQVRESLRSGQSLSQAMHLQPSWFDLSEVAMVNAGQHGGNLPTVLRSLASRHEKSGELSGKLVSALAYPAIVTCVGIGVVIFLSVKTLPDLTSVLTSAKIEPPALTMKVMGIGQFISKFGLVVLVVGIPVLIALATIVRRLGCKWIYPKVVRRIAIARLAQQLAELKQSGVPMVESLRVLAPTAAGHSADLQRVIMQAADRIERGAELSEALDDEFWFDAEFRRLLDIGQSSGELDELLLRIANRYSRQATRLIERLSALLEPAAILLIAILVGTVVMAAVLPLLRLREVL